jgi:beta-glucan synthesis-associated protein KRE6
MPANVFVLNSAGYPLITYFTKHDISNLGGFNLGGTNASGQVRNLFGVLYCIDLSIIGSEHGWKLGID